MNIYLIEDCGNNPGRVYAIMSNEEDAINMAEHIECNLSTQCEVVERHLWYGQLPSPNYHK